MTISSHKDMLPVRLGLEPDNATALTEAGYDPALADNMNGSELDMHIIDQEYNRVMEYYKDNPDGERLAHDWKRQAIKQAMEN